MDYEKKYKEALERAKRWADGTLMPPDNSAKTISGTIFPELTESEDERVAKEIKQFILDNIGEISIDDKEYSWITWLERQKETEKEVSELFDCTDSYNKGYRAGQEKALQELKNHIKEDKTQCYAYDAGYASGFIVGKEQGWKERGKYEKQKEQKPSDLPDCQNVFKVPSKPMQVIQKCEETEKSALKKCEEVDLEEEIKRYWKEEMPVVLESDLNDIARHFAEWQREQILKDAVEGEVHHCASVHYCTTNEEQLGARLKMFRDGDKVKIIIIKED